MMIKPTQVVQALAEIEIFGLYCFSQFEKTIVRTVHQLYLKEFR